MEQHLAPKQKISIASRSRLWIENHKTIEGLHFNIMSALRKLSPSQKCSLSNSKKKIEMEETSQVFYTVFI